MSVKVIDTRFATIIEAVCYWLGYQSKIGREHLIHEASLRYPIADTITANGVNINQIELEKLHPYFKSRKIDLVIYDESVSNLNVERKDEDVKEVFEFKLAKNETSKEKGIEHQRVFDDVVRLAYYHLWGGKECYFLMCGKYDEFKVYFIGQQTTIQNKDGKNTVKPTNISSDDLKIQEWNSEGLYKDWFGFKIGEEKTVEFKNDTENWGLSSFIENYKIRSNTGKTYKDSISIKTTCMAITPNGLKTRTHAVGIWKIEGLS